MYLYQNKTAADAEGENAVRVLVAAPSDKKVLNSNHPKDTGGTFAKIRDRLHIWDPFLSLELREELHF